MKSKDLVRRLCDLFPDEDNSGFNSFDLIHKFASPLTALLYSELFWPSFVEFDDMVFLASEVEDEEDRDRVRSALARSGGDRQEVEQSFNYVEVPYLFGSKIGESTEQEDEVLARRLAEMWKARLAHLFSERQFEVHVVEPNQSEEVFGLCFFQRARQEAT